jgi:hypothetical protein
MANYKETTGTGTTWRRAKQVLIKNDIGSAPKPILFFEEDVANIGGKTFANDAGLLQTNYNPEYVINLRNPQTGEPTGNVITQALVYQALYSLYLDVAQLRDNPVDLGEPNLIETPNL